MYSFVIVCMDGPYGLIGVSLLLFSCTLSISYNRACKPWRDHVIARHHLCNDVALFIVLSLQIINNLADITVREHIGLVTIVTITMVIVANSVFLIYTASNHLSLVW